MKNILNAAAGVTTAAPISPGTVGDILPEFLEVPDVPRLFGIRRTTLYCLMKTGEIKSVLLRRPGHRSGKRLVSAVSCRDFLNREMEKQKGAYLPGICNAVRNKKEGK